jgi:flagellar biogenesis protein FliO
MNGYLIYATAVCAATAVLFGWIAFRPRTRGGRSDEDGLRVVTRTRVGVGRTLVLVEVAGRRLLLGSTRRQWCALADLGSANPEDPDHVFQEIEDELLRASESAARHRRRPRS